MIAVETQPGGVPAVPDDDVVRVVAGGPVERAATGMAAGFAVRPRRVRPLALTADRG
jgi:hypothetical protein